MTRDQEIALAGLLLKTCRMADVNQEDSNRYFKIAVDIAESYSREYQKVEDSDLVKEIKSLEKIAKCKE